MIHEQIFINVFVLPVCHRLIIDNVFPRGT